MEDNESSKKGTNLQFIRFWLESKLLCPCKAGYLLVNKETIYLGEGNCLVPFIGKAYSVHSLFTCKADEQTRKPSKSTKAQGL